MNRRCGMVVCTLGMCSVRIGQLRVSRSRKEHSHGSHLPDNRRGIFPVVWVAHLGARSPLSRMPKKSASGVLAKHCRLTNSAAFANVTLLIRRVANLRSSTYPHGKRACLGRWGWAGKNVTPRSKTLPAHHSPACASMTLFTHRVAHLTAALPGTRRVSARRGLGG